MVYTLFSESHIVSLHTSTSPGRCQQTTLWNRKVQFGLFRTIQLWVKQQTLCL